MENEPENLKYMIQIQADTPRPSTEGISLRAFNLLGQTEKTTQFCTKLRRVGVLRVGSLAEYKNPSLNF